MSGSADRRDAPTTSTMDFGPTANGHGTTKDYVSGANASLPDANVSPAGHSTHLHLRFRWGPYRQTGVSRELPRAPSIPYGLREPQEGELHCVPPAPCLHARSLELRNNQGPQWPTSARLPARRALPAVPASSNSCDDGPSRRQPFTTAVVGLRGRAEL